MAHLNYSLIIGIKKNYLIRKRNQIYLLRNVINEIKGSFNKEFEQMTNYRAVQVDTINDRNKRIADILADL